MSSARSFRVRVWRVGATAALTVAASGLITAGTTSAASADVICSYAGGYVTTFVFRTTDVCMTTDGPYSCSYPDAGLGTTFDVYAVLCVID